MMFLRATCLAYAFPTCHHAGGVKSAILQLSTTKDKNMSSNNHLCWNNYSMYRPFWTPSRYALRFQALSWYRKIFRADLNWDGRPADSISIQTEVRELYEQNRHLESRELIKKKLFEAETRYELALHYQIPHPRLYHLPSGGAAEPYRDAVHADFDDSDSDAYKDEYFTQMGGRQHKVIIPAYMHSYMDAHNKTAGSDADTQVSPSKKEDE